MFPIFYLCLLYRLSLSALATAAVLRPDSSDLNWTLFVFTTPVLFTLLFDLARRGPKRFFSHNHVELLSASIGQKRLLLLPIPSITAFTKVVLVSAAAGHALCDERGATKAHFAAWVLMTAWIHFLAKVRKCPGAPGVHVHVLVVVLGDVVRLVRNIM